MTEPDFRALRDHLEGTATQPAFDVISRRRHQRTQRWASAGAASLVLVVLAGIVLAIRGNGDRHEPPVAPPASKVTSVSAHPSGTLFALDPGREQIFYSTDRGSHWRPLGPQIHDTQFGHGRLAAANSQATWMVTDDQVFYVTSGDWMGLRVEAPGEFSVAKERLWLIAAGQVQIWNARTDPFRTTALPVPAVKIAALSAEAAMVMTQDSQWYYTYDAGLSWHPRTVPCLASNMASAPDRSLWLACDRGLFVSTNDGETWDILGPMGNAYIYPVSKTMAWSADQSGQVYHDRSGGPVWSAVPTEAGAFGFSAADAETAIRFSSYGVYVTQDGGFSWTSVTLPVG